MKGQLLAIVSAVYACVLHVAAITNIPSQPVWATVLPTVSPLTDDSWECATEEMAPYFDVPPLTGDLVKAINTYWLSIQSKTCTLTGIDQLDCPYPDKQSWCRVTKDLAPSLSSSYSAYGSAASSWWAAHSSKAVLLAQECPRGWYDNMLHTNGARRLNYTIIMAECYDEGKITSTGRSTTTKPPTATPGSGVTTRPTAPQTTTTSSKSGSRGRGEAPGIWAVLGGGFAAAAAGAQHH
jgi:hypothetical protein